MIMYKINYILYIYMKINQSVISDSFLNWFTLRLRLCMKLIVD